MVGEIWSERRQLTKGDTFDALMHYQILFRSLDFFIPDEGGIYAEELQQRLQAKAHIYPRATRQATMNLLGTHDTDRVISKFINQDQYHNYESDLEDGFRDDNPIKVDPKVVDRAKLYYTFLYTREGAPWSPITTMTVYLAFPVALRESSKNWKASSKRATQL